MLAVPELEFMHIHKTGALIRAAALLGARCGNGLNEEELAQVDTFAKCVGLAFQVVDDVLDADSSTATLGKTAGKDAQYNKPTYVSAMGTARARELAQSCGSRRSMRWSALDRGNAPARAGGFHRVAKVLIAMLKCLMLNV